MTLSHCTIDSPIGTLSLVADDDSLVEVRFANSPLDPGEGGVEDAAHSVLRRAAHELDEYFAGDRQEFSFRSRPTARRSNSPRGARC